MKVICVVFPIVTFACETLDQKRVEESTKTGKNELIRN